MAEPTPVLELQAVSKNFGGLQVINSLSFAVHKGARMALIGPNGAGKTTVFNLISGVYAVDDGRILLDDRDITTMPSARRIRLGLARSFQNIRLMTQLTALENVMLGQHWRARGVMGLLNPVRGRWRNAWADEARNALAEAGLAEIADGRVAGLPYGVQKRIELVRAFVAKPKVLLLDEPAAGLNEKETEEVRVLLERISERGVTLLVVEHDMPFIADLCEHVVVLNFGSKIAEGTHAEVRTIRGVREAYLGTDEDESDAA